MELNEDLTFEEEHVAIVDHQMHQLISKVIPIDKYYGGTTMWKNTRGRQAEMRAAHPYLFPQ